jgi:hypothetical protein
VSGISSEETVWLRGHLVECGECARREENTGRMLRAMGELQFEGGGRRAPLAWTGHKRRWPVPLAVAAAVLLMAAVPSYRSAREAEDAALLERVGTHVSRSVPQALEPLMHPEAGDYR